MAPMVRSTKRVRKIRAPRRIAVHRKTRTHHSWKTKDSTHSNVVGFSNTDLNKVPRLPFKDNFYTKLSYVRQLPALSTYSSADTIASYLFNINNINGLYGAGGTGTHLPYGYASLASLYKYVEVLGIKYEVTFQDPSGDGMWVGLMVQGDGNPVGQTLQRVRERPRVVGDFISNTGEQTRTFSGYLKPYQALGLNRIQYKANIDQYAVLLDSLTQLNTNRIVYMQCMASNANSNISAPTVQVSVKLELYVKAFQLKTQNESIAP